jgi:hypothetical protein
MIFVVETEERTLRVFTTEAEAIASCEALDVEAGIWLFWQDDGAPLEPVFTVPNKRGLFAVKNGVYRLQPANELHHAHLSEAVDEVLNFEGPAPFLAAAPVKAHLQGAQRKAPA